MTVTRLRTARAVDHPCELYAHTAAPIPSRTQRHHRFPEYLQRAVWGEERDDEDVMWLCGTCHDNVHEAIGWLLGETRQPNPMPGYKTLVEARYSIGRYRTALAGAA
jgi:hypothetical protein